MGSLLMKRGMTPGMRTDEMNQAHPEAVESIHRAYAEAGSDILYTNTFSLSSRLAVMADEELDAAVADAVAIARRAAEGRALAALDVGPTGEFMEPYGALTYGIAYSRFRRLAVSGERAGADLICVETMSAPDELRAAVTAAAENTKLDIVATMTFAETGLTYTGFSIEEFGEMANGLPLLAAGVNCSRDPEQMLPAITRLAQAAGRKAERRTAGRAGKVQRRSGGIRGAAASLPGTGRPDRRRMLRYHAGVHSGRETGHGIITAISAGGAVPTERRPPRRIFHRSEKTADARKLPSVCRFQRFCDRPSRRS